jgi:hypothetical protein
MILPIGPTFSNSNETNAFAKSDSSNYENTRESPSNSSKAGLGSSYSGGISSPLRHIESRSPALSEADSSYSEPIYNSSFNRRMSALMNNYNLRLRSSFLAGELNSDSE